MPNTPHAPAADLFEPLEPRQLLSFVVWDGGGGDHEWSNPLNWSGDALPGAADNVLIDAPGTAPIHIGQDVSIASLWSLDPLNITGGAFTVAGLWKQSAALSLSAGTVQGAGNLQLNADFNWSGGAVLGDQAAKIQVLPGNTMTIAGDVTLGRQLINNGTLNWTSGDITADGAQILNLVGRTFTIQSAGSLLSTGNPTYFINKGTLIRTGEPGATTTISVVFSNQRAIYFDPFIPAGTVDVQSGTLQFTGAVVNKQGSVLSGGIWRVHSGGELLLPGPDITDASGVTDVGFWGPGSAFPQIEGAFSVAQLDLLDGRAFTFSHIGENSGTGVSNVFIHSPGVTTNIPAVVLHNLAVDAGGVVLADGVLVSTLDVERNASAQVGSDFTFDTITGPGVVAFTGHVTWRDGDIRGTGQLIIAATGRLDLMQSQVYYSAGKVIRRPILNYGIIEWFDGDASGSQYDRANDVQLDGEIENEGQFIVHSHGFAMPESYYGEPGNQPGVITNGGTFTIDTDGDFKLRGAYGGITLVNLAPNIFSGVEGGIVHLVRGRLLAYGGASGGGYWTMDQGTSLVFGGLPAALTGAVFDGAGRIRVGANLVLTNATMTGSGDLVVPFLGRLGLLGTSTSITRSAVANDGLISLGLGSVTLMQTSLTSTGVLALSTGSLRITGDLALTSTSVVRVRSAGSNQHGSLAVSGHASLAGALDAVFTWQPSPALTFQFLTFGSRTGGFSIVVSDGVAPAEAVHVQFIGQNGSVRLG